MKKNPIVWLLPLGIAIGVAAAYWVRSTRAPVPESAPEMPTVTQPAATEAEPPPVPLHPLEPMQTITEEQDPVELVPLPPLDESDEYFEIELVDIFGESLVEMLADSGVIEKIVATVDNLPRSRVAERIRPIGKVSGQFQANGQDSSGEYTIDSANFDRYDTVIGLATTADLEAIVDVYRRFYPLFQSAYVDLGYPDGYFNDRLVEVIDNLLETPEFSEPLELVRPHVLYEYRDEDLEALSAGQKLMLRIGSDHAAVVRERLTTLRTRITTMEQ